MERPHRLVCRSLLYIAGEKERILQATATGNRDFGRALERLLSLAALHSVPDFDDEGMFDAEGCLGVLQRRRTEVVVI